VADGLSLKRPEIAIVSNVSGGEGGEELATPEYWVGHVRETVRFSDGVRWLETVGVTRFLELGPDGVLSALAGDCLSTDAEEHALLVSALRARHPEGRDARRPVGAAQVGWRARRLVCGVC